MDEERVGVSPGRVPELDAETARWFQDEGMTDGEQAAYRRGFENGRKQGYRAGYGSGVADEVEAGQEKVRQEQWTGRQRKARAVTR